MIVLEAFTCARLNYEDFDCNTEPATEDDPVPGGTIFTCDCEDEENETGPTTITFPTDEAREFPFSGPQTLRAECVAEDTYEITLTPGLPPRFNISAEQTVVCSY